MSVPKQKEKGFHILLFLFLHMFPFHPVTDSVSNAETYGRVKQLRSLGAFVSDTVFECAATSVSLFVYVCVWHYPFEGNFFFLPSKDSTVHLSVFWKLCVFISDMEKKKTSHEFTQSAMLRLVIVNELDFFLIWKESDFAEIQKEGPNKPMPLFDHIFN